MLKGIDSSSSEITANIPASIVLACLEGDIAQIEAAQISAENKQWLYKTALKKGHKAAASKLTSDSKLDLLYEAVNNNDLTMVLSVLSSSQKEEYANEKNEEEIGNLYINAMQAHQFEIAQALLDFFNEEKFISTNVICENIQFLSASSEHDNAIIWIFSKARIQHTSIDSHNKAVVLLEMADRSNEEMIKSILRCLTPEDKKDGDFLEVIEDECHDALEKNKDKKLKLLLPMIDNQSLQELFESAVEKGLLNAMPCLLEEAQNRLKHPDPTDETKPLSPEQQTNYLRQLLEKIPNPNAQVLACIKSQAQAQTNHAIVQLIDKILAPTNTVSDVKPPLVFSAAISSIPSESPTSANVEKQKATTDETLLPKAESDEKLRKKHTL